MQDGGRAARAALPPVLQSVEELKSIVASARYAPVPPPPLPHLSAAERCACRWAL
jgi:2-keto-3-deoxy-L-rhamnonate aldolase RhmA